MLILTGKVRLLEKISIVSISECSYPNSISEYSYPNSRSLLTQSFTPSITTYSRSMANPTFPSTMKALLQPPDDYKNLILTTRPVPTPKPHSTEHLIRVHMTAITNGELLWPTFAPIPEGWAKEKEYTPCYDVAGTVIIAPPSSPYKPGDEVYGRTNYYRTGCAREYTIVPTDELALRPRRLSWAESATVPMSAQTAWQALFIQAGLKAEAGVGAKGKRVFVTAASGGAGTWIVQLAKWAGAEVVGTCGTNNVDWVKSVGADEVIDYKRVNVKDWVNEVEGREVDIVIDCIGRKSLEDGWWAVKDGGVLMSIYGPPEQVKPAELVGKDHVKNFFFIMKPDAQQLGKITQLIDEGHFVPALDSIFPFEKYEEAFAKVASGKTRGKVVLDLGVTS